MVGSNVFQEKSAAEQAALGNSALSFELVHKDAYNAAMAAIEAEDLGMVVDMSYGADTKATARVVKVAPTIRYMQNGLRLSAGLLVSYEKLVAVGIAESTINSGLLRNRNGAHRAWQHEYDDAGRLWVLYDTLPSATKEKVSVYFGGDVYKACKDMLLIQGAKKAERLSDRSELEKMENLTIVQLGDLVKAAGWLRYLSEVEFWKRLEMGKTNGYVYAAELIGSIGLYGFKVSNGRVLERKVNEWRRMGLGCLRSEKFGTMNAVKVPVSAGLKAGSREEGNRKGCPHNPPMSKVEMRKLAEERLFALYQDPRKPTVQMVTAIYNAEAIERGMMTYTWQRVYQILMADKMKWKVSRDGVNAVRAEREVIIKRTRPTAPNEMWSIDGTTVQLYGYDKDGNITKVGYWVLVVDTATDCIIGYAFGVTETTLLVLEALRMAVKRCNKLPDFIQYDGAKANMSSEVKDLLKNMETKGLRAQPYNGKSKYVERIIGILEQVFMRMLLNFVGGNRTAKKASSRANVDLIQKMKKEDLYHSHSSVKEEMKMVIETYNHSKVARLGMSRYAAYMKGRVADPAENELMVVALFWVRKADTIKYMQNGLTMRLGNNRYEYVVETGKRGVESEEFRSKYLGKSFVVRYNPDDLSRVHLYDKDDRHVAVAMEKYAFSAIPQEGEMGVLKEIWQRRKDAIAESKAASERRAAEQAALGNSALSFELVHKDAYNAAMAAIEAEDLGMVVDMSYGADTKATARVAPTRVTGATARVARTDAEEDIVSMYDVSDVESGKVIDWE